MSLTQKQWSTILLVLLCGIPVAAIWFEQTAPAVWQQYLLEPLLFGRDPDRHTPYVTTGTYLPSRLTEDTTLTAAAGPVLIAHDTRVEPGVVLRVEPGVQLLFHEFATLSVYGEIELAGTAQQPVALASNEVHPANQQWGGLIFFPGSRGQLTYTTLRQAIPAVACHPASRVTISDSTITNTEVGLITYTPDCRVQRSSIAATNIGVIAIDATPTLPDTKITAGSESIKHVTADAPFPSPRTR